MTYKNILNSPKTTFIGIVLFGISIFLILNGDVEKGCALILGGLPFLFMNDKPPLT